MAVIAERRLALLGGGFSTDGDGLLDDWVLDQVAVPRPKVCFIPTASGDAPAYIEQFFEAYQSRSCESSVLCLFGGSSMTTPCARSCSLKTSSM